MGSALLIAIVVLAGTGGELVAANAIRQFGEVKSFEPRVLFRVVAGAFRLGRMWIGVGLMAIAFYSLLVLLSREPVSFAVPATGLNYAVGALGGRIFLHEQVSAIRWAGLFLVCLGVALASVG